jgi:hypothetical protein
MSQSERPVFLLIRVKPAEIDAAIKATSEEYRHSLRAYPVMIDTNGRLWPQSPYPIEVVDLKDGGKGFVTAPSE